MKSVMFSEIVHAHRLSWQLGKLSPLTAYGVIAAVGMPMLVLALRHFAPAAPLAAIILPILAGLALPLCAGTPGCLEIRTRFDACHLRGALDDALAGLGYAQVVASADRTRYVRTVPASWYARAHSVNVRIGEHTLDVVGPIRTLHALQAALAGAPVHTDASQAAAEPILSSLETVAAAIQISDNAGRVAGMAE